MLQAVGLGQTIKNALSIDESHSSMVSITEKGIDRRSTTGPQASFIKTPTQIEGPE